MRQALHIFRKDFRRGWPLLLLWALVIGYAAQRAWRDPFETEELAIQASGMEGLLMLLAGMIGAALVVQQDALVGEREFWLTRPIRSWSLMAAKALFIGIFLVLPPSVIQLVLLARSGLQPESWLAAAFETALPWACLLAFAALLGAWTKGLAGWFAFLFALFLGPQILVSLFLGHQRRTVGIDVASPPLLALGVVAISLLALQYATRKRVFGWFTGVGAVLLLALAPKSIGLSDSWRGPNLGAIRVELTPGPGRAAFEVARSEHPGVISGEFAFVPAPSEVFPEAIVQIGPSEGEIRWSDGSASSFSSSYWDLPGASPPLPGLKRAADASSVPRNVFRVFGDEPFDSFLGRTGRLGGHADGFVWKLADVRTLDLEPGAEIERGSYKARILRVEEPFRVRARIREIRKAQRVVLALAPRTFLVNLARGEALPLRPETTAAGVNFGFLATGPYTLSVREDAWTVDGPVPSADWLSDAEIVVAFHDYAGYLDVTLEADNFVVDQTAAAGSLDARVTPSQRMKITISP